MKNTIKQPHSHYYCNSHGFPPNTLCVSGQTTTMNILLSLLYFKIYYSTFRQYVYISWRHKSDTIVMLPPSCPCEKILQQRLQEINLAQKYIGQPITARGEESLDTGWFKDAPAHQLLWCPQTGWEERYYWEGFHR